MSNIYAAAEFLLQNRLQQSDVDNLPENLYPASEEAGYLVQDALVDKLAKHYDSHPCGYKVASTNTAVMQLLGTDGPFSGRMLDHSTYQNNAQLKAANFTRRVVELEFMFVMARDVTSTNELYDAQSIQPFIGELVPGVEIVDHRYKDFTQVGGNALIADNAIHGACILGEAVENWRDVDLANHDVELIINRKSGSKGCGANVLGSPLNVMAWLANHLQVRGGGLKSGDIITTGTACDIYNAVAGDEIVADYGCLGSVEFSFV